MMTGAAELVEGLEEAMSERKPHDLPRESWVDRQIREARERGDFDRLEGEGRPLDGLGEVHDPLWWVKSWIKRERLSVLPRALSLRRRVEEELARLPSIASEAEVRRRLDRLNADIARANAGPAEVPQSGLAPCDVEALVARWRRARGQGD